MYQKVYNNSEGNTKAYFTQCKLIRTPSFANNMYHCLDDDDKKTVFTDNRSRDDNTAPTSEIADDYSVDSDEENMKINPSKIILPTRAQVWKQYILKGNLRAQMVFNTSNIKIAVDMSIINTGATEHFVLPGTPVKNTNPIEKPLCINLPDVKQIKSSHTCQIYILWLTEAATRAHIVPVLTSKSLVSIKMICVLTV